MNKIILTICYVGLIFFMLSCGPSQESIRREMKLKMEAKMALQDSIKTTKELKLKYEQAITVAKGELEVAKDRMLRIKEWQFGRSSEEREEQIRNQTIAIGKIENYIDKLQKSIPIIENKITRYAFDLQNLEAQINK